MEDFEKYFEEIAGKCYCRFCLKLLKESDTFILLLRIQETLRDYKKFLPVTLFDENSRHDPEISPFICKECHEALNQTIKFLEMVSSSEEKLQQALNKYQLRMVKQEPEIEVKTELGDDLGIDNIVFVKQNLSDKLISESGVTKALEKKETYTCDVCSKILTTKVGYSFHMQQHNNNVETKNIDIKKYLICELCDPKPNFPTFEEMSKHYQDTHDTPGYVICCNRKFLRKLSVIKHEDVHLNPHKFICTICLRLCASSRRLRYHKLLLHGSESERIYECDLCSKRFPLKNNLAQHIKYFHLKIPIGKKHACHICGKVLVNKTSLTKHLACVHNIGEIIWEICDKCGFKTKYKGEFNKHLKRAHSDKDCRTECTICGEKVINIKIHMELKHFGTPQKCKICGHETKNEKSMKNHMKSHTDEKRFKCTECGQSFRLKVGLTDHMSQHTGKPGYFCDYCDKTFNNSGNKYKHIKQVHALEREANKKRKMMN